MMEFAEGGSLKMLIYDKSISLTWSKRLTMLEEIAMGIQVLHSHDPEVSSTRRETETKLISITDSTSGFETSKHFT